MNKPKVNLKTIVFGRIVRCWALVGPVRILVFRTSSPASPDGPQVNGTKIKREKIRVKRKAHALKEKHEVVKVLTKCQNRSGKAARRALKVERRALREAIDKGEVTVDEVEVGRGLFFALKNHSLMHTRPLPGDQGGGARAGEKGPEDRRQAGGRRGPHGHGLTRHHSVTNKCTKSRARATVSSRPLRPPICPPPPAEAAFYPLDS